MPIITASLTTKTAVTRPGFLRLFYSLNRKATRRYFGVQLHDDGADILHGDGRTATSFMRVRPASLASRRTISSVGIGLPISATVEPGELAEGS
jgi:hypothetical protein